MPPDAETSPIFVVGTGRSGTTLLRMMLCAHPRIYLTHEASFYVWEANRRFAYPEFLKRYINGFSYRWLRLDPRPLLDSLPSNAVHRDFYTALMRSMAARYGKARWGDKTPSHAGNLARIFEDYPEAKVIRIVRDPRDVVRSLNRMPWGPASRIAGAMLVGTEHRQCGPFRDRLLEVRMEDLVASPRDVMGTVLDFVGEPFDEAVLDHTRHLPEPSDLPPVPWFQSATKRPGTPTAAVWLDPVEIRLLEFLNGSVMRAHGYTPAKLGDEPGKLAMVWRYLFDVPELLRSMWVLLKMLRQGETGRDDAASKALTRSLNPDAWKRYPGFEMPDVPENPEGWQAHLPK